MENEMNADGLLPCPFCGGEPIMLKDHKRLGYYVACQACFAGTATSDKAGAFDGWNRRAALSTVPPGED